jgi:hypothetical protein
MPKMSDKFDTNERIHLILDVSSSLQEVINNLLPLFGVDEGALICVF